MREKDRVDERTTKEMNTIGRLKTDIKIRVYFDYSRDRSIEIYVIRRRHRRSTLRMKFDEYIGTRTPRQIYSAVMEIP